MKRPERVAAVDKIEDQRKPEDFIGHRNRGACAAISKRGKLLFEICHTIPIQISTSKATITTRAEMINP